MTTTITGLPLETAAKDLDVLEKEESDGASPPVVSSHKTYRRDLYRGIRKINTPSGAHVLAVDDEDALLSFDTSASPLPTCGIALDSTVELRVGTRIICRRTGTGNLVVTAVAGVTLNGVDAGSIAAATDNQAVILVKISANTWWGYLVSEAAPSGGSALEVEDESVSLSTAVTKINFAGAGVTATEPVADEILVTIPGGGGGGAGGGSLEYVGEYTVSAGTEIDIPLTDGDAEKYHLQFEFTVGTDNAGLELVITDDGFTSVETGASDYQYSAARRGSGTVGIQSAGDDSIFLTNALGNAGNERVFADLFITTPGDVAETTGFNWIGGTWANTGVFNDLEGAGEYVQTSRINGIRILPTSGTITGKVRVYKYLQSSDTRTLAKLVTTSTYTFSAEDAGKTLYADTTSNAIAFVLPKKVTDDLGAGWFASVVLKVAGSAVTIECEDANVDLNGVADEVLTLGTTAYSSSAFISMMADASGARVDDEFVVIGDVTA